MKRDATKIKLKRLEELASAETFDDAEAQDAAFREMAEILAALPWKEWASDPSATVDKFRFFIMLEPAAIDGRAGAKLFLPAAVKAARRNPAACRLVLDFPGLWPCVELSDLKNWVAARPPAVGDALADRVGPHQARNIVPPPNLAAQLELIGEILTNIPDGRASAASVLGEWIRVRAEAGERAENALKRTIAAVADMLRDAAHEERVPFLVKLAMMPSLEEEAVRELIKPWADDAPQVQISLAALATEMDLDEAAPFLLKLAEAETPEARDAALQALIKIAEKGNYLDSDVPLAGEIIVAAAKHGAAADLLESARKIFKISA